MKPTRRSYGRMNNAISADKTTVTVDRGEYYRTLNRLITLEAAAKEIVSAFEQKQVLDAKIYALKNATKGG